MNYTFIHKRQSVPTLNTDPRLWQRQMNRNVDRKVDDVKDDDEETHVAVTGIQSESETVEDSDIEKLNTKDGFPQPSQLRTGIKDFRQRKKETTSISPGASVGEKKTESNGLLSKAFTDTIIKNFTSKICAIEDQIRGEANWWSMTEEGATFPDNRAGKRSMSIPIESTVRVLPVNKPPPFQLRPLQKLQTAQHPYQNRTQQSHTGPQNTPRTNYMDSYILNPLNLEAARPKQFRLDGHVKPSYHKEKSKQKSKLETDHGGDCFQTSRFGKSNHRDAKVDMFNEPDILAPSVALPELLCKKLGVSVSSQKWL